MTVQGRSTKVVSVSLEPEIVEMLDQISKTSNRSRSSVVAELIKSRSFAEEWRQIRAWGEKTARKLKITSEEDVYKLLGDA